MAGKKYDVKDLRLADGGRKRILWAGQDMPVLAKSEGAVSERKAAARHALLRVSPCHR